MVVNPVGRVMYVAMFVVSMCAVTVRSRIDPRLLTIYSTETPPPEFNIQGLGYFKISLTFYDYLNITFTDKETLVHLRLYGSINKHLDSVAKFRTDIVDTFSRSHIGISETVWTFIHSDVRIKDGDFFQFWIEATKWNFSKLHTLIRTIVFNKHQAQ